MRMIFGLVLVVGIALAGAAVYLAQGYFAGSENALAQAQKRLNQIGPLTPVYVVKKTVAYGAPITRDDVQPVLWQSGALPEGTFSDIEVLFPENAPKQRYATRQIEKFEPLLAKKITEPGRQAGLMNQLGRGIQAFTLRVDATAAVSGFVNPGDYVDIFWTGAAPGTEGALTRLIESAVKVVAVDQSTNGDRAADGSARTVTLAVNREQVARLVQAQNTGKMSLSLVSAPDDTATGLIEVDRRAMLGIEEEQAAPVVEKQVCTIKTRKGAEIIETEIPCTN